MRTKEIRVRKLTKTFFISPQPSPPCLKGGMSRKRQGGFSPFPSAPVGTALAAVLLTGTREGRPYYL